MVLLGTVLLRQRMDQNHSLYNWHLRRLKTKHDGEKIASTLVDIIHEYNILPSELGVFMGDNEEANDKAVRLVLKELYPGIKQKEILARRGVRIP